MVRIMGAGYSGGFFYAVTLLSFGVLLFSGSIETGITYYGSKDFNDIPALSIVLLPWLVLLSLLAYAAVSSFPVFINRWLSFGFIMSNVVLTYMSALFYARRWFFSLNLILSLVNMAALVALFFVFYNPASEVKAGTAINMAAIIFVAIFVVQAVLLLVFFYVSEGFLHWHWIINKPLISKVVKYSSLAFVANLITFFVLRLDYFFVQKYCSPVALSNYVQVSKMGQLLIMLPSMVATVIFPYSSGTSGGGYLPILQSVCRVVTILFIPVFLFFLVAGQWLFPWLFGEGFRQMYVAMLLYLPGFYALSMVTLLASFLAGNGMVKANLIASVLALAVIILGNVLLVPIFGINAAAAFSSAGYIVCGLYLLWVYKKKFQGNTADFFAINKVVLKDIFDQVKNVTLSIK